MSNPDPSNNDPRNNDPSAIVPHGFPSIGGLYINFDSNGENRGCEVRTLPLNPKPDSVGRVELKRFWTMNLNHHST